MSLEREQEEAMYDKLEKRRVKETYTVGELSSSVEVEFGTTLRDKFAIAALTGFIIQGQGSIEEIAEAAYITANAMMKAREK